MVNCDRREFLRTRDKTIIEGETSAEYFVLKRIGIDKIGSISLVTQDNFIVQVVVD